MSARAVRACEDKLLAGSAGPFKNCKWESGRVKFSF